MTLVELIVTFALIGLFMTAAALMVSSTLRLFTRMQATSHAITVSDMILDKVAGEISAAILPVGNPGADDYYFWMDSSDGGDWVTFKNRMGSPIAIFAAHRNEDGSADTANADSLGEGELFVRYYELAGGGNVREQPEVDWRYDDRVYMGYQITELSFSQADKEHNPGVIRIDLVLKHKDTGFVYPTYRFARIYNTVYANGDYIGERTEGLPENAEDFEIKDNKDPGGGDDPKQENTKYYVQHKIDGNIVLQEEYSAENGSSFYIYPKDSSEPGFEGYQATEASLFVEIHEGLVETYIFEYVPIRTGAYSYLIRCHIDSSYQGNYTVGSTETGYLGSGSRSNWELYQEVRRADLEDNGKLGIPPVIEGYVPMLPEYTIKVDSTYQVMIDIPYKPVDVNVIIYAKCGEELLDKTVLTGRYQSTIDLKTKKKIEGYSSSTTDVKIPVFQLTDIEYVIYYLKEDAPFRPIKEQPEVKVNPNVSEEWMECYQELAWKFTDFFMNNWSTMENPRIGYRTFELEGKKYAIAGLCDLNSSHNISSYSKKIEDATGVAKNDTIYLTDVNGGFKNSGDSEVLWEYLISQIGLTGQQEELLNKCVDRKLQFTEVWINNLKFYYLKEITFTIPAENEAYVKISFGQNW